MSWTVRRLGWDLLIVREDNPDIDIASMTERLNWEANAHLIAAAPDLLAAAEEVLRSSHSGCACFECDQLAAAIKKAKGQQ